MLSSRGTPSSARERALIGPGRPGLRFLWLLLPISLILPAWWLLGSDWLFFLGWWFALALPGWAAWPLAARLFPGHDGGYLLAKPLGLLISAFWLWTMSYLHILPFTRWAIILVLMLLSACWFWQDGRKQIGSLVRSPAGPASVAFGEFLFGSALLFWTFARGLKPELDSLEKFMDLGLMNSLWRTEYLPALDIWLAGGKINYYYFGQYLYTFVAKLTAIRPEIAYNLSMATTFAMTLALGYAAVRAMIGLASKTDTRLGGAASTAGGLVAGLLLAFGGNGQSFFYDQNSPAHPLLLWLSRIGFLDGSNPNKNYWFADATRFIGYNPETADKTIHEFPYYSFLVADLHAHVVNLAVVLLLIVLLVRLIDNASLQQAASDCHAYQLRQQPANDRQWHREAIAEIVSRFRRTAANGPLLVIIMLLGISMMGNYWDFAIYFLVTSMVLLLANRRGYGRISSPVGLLVFLLQMILILVPYLAISKPIVAAPCFIFAMLAASYLTIIRGDALTMTGAQMAWIFGLAHLLTLPFSFSFEPISKSIALAVNHTPAWQILVLWGPHLLAGCLLAIGLLAGFQPGGRLRRVFPPDDVDKVAATLPGGHLNRVLNLMNQADLLALVLFACGLALLVVPELVYVVDIYSGDYKRANTMFKFTYQAFVLLTLVWAYALARINAAWAGALRLRHKKPGKTSKQPRFSWVEPICGLLLVLLLIFPVWYPVASTTQWLGDFQLARYKGLNGLPLLALKDSVQDPEQGPGDLAPDVAAIEWLNETIAGQPVVLEAYGESYTDYCRISAFTGLPTVLGWETHEWLWRTSKANPDAYGSVVLPRQQDIWTLYTTVDQELRRELLEKYQVAYVVIGDLERAKFAEKFEDGSQRSLVQEDLFFDLGTTVFQADDLVIVKID